MDWLQDSCWCLCSPQFQNLWISWVLLLILSLKRLGFDATELGSFYRSLVLSTRTFGIILLDGCSASNLQKVDQVRRREVRMGFASDYKPTAVYNRLNDRQLMIEIKDIGTNLLRRIINERSDYAQRCLRDCHFGCKRSREQRALQNFFF